MSSLPARATGSPLWGFPAGREGSLEELCEDGEEVGRGFQLRLQL